MANDWLLVVLGAIILLALWLIIYLAPQSGLSSHRRSRRLTLRDGIASLDFSGIRRKLTTNAKYQWNETRINAAQTEYTRFLFLIGTNPGQVIVPWSEDLDEFWHLHILDTATYARDCQMLFGRMIHHNPNIERSPTAYAEAKQQTSALRQQLLSSHSQTWTACAYLGGTCSTSHDHDGHSSGHDSGSHGGHCSSGSSSDGGGSSCSSGSSCGSSCGGGCGGG